MKTETQRFEFPSHSVEAPDGTRLRVFDLGGDGPALVLANGLGGPVSAFGPHAAKLRSHYRILSWDYRGTYGSTLASPDSSLDVATHARDLLHIADHLSLSRFHYVGWSMGVQVGLEVNALAPQRVQSFVFLSGTFGRPFQGVRFPVVNRMLPAMVRGARHLDWLGRPFLERASRTAWTSRAVKATRFIAPAFDDKRFAELLDEFKTLDLALYFRLLAELGEHDAEALLKNISVPLLVIVGTRDVLTPPATARRIASSVPGAELFIIPNATHYAAAEYPDLVSERLLEFLSATKLATEALEATHPTASN